MRHLPEYVLGRSGPNLLKGKTSLCLDPRVIFMCNVMNLCFSEPLVRDFSLAVTLRHVLGAKKAKTSWTSHFAVYYGRLQGQIYFVLSSKRCANFFQFSNLINVGSAHDSFRLVL